MKITKILALACLLAFAAPTFAQQAVSAEEQAMLDEEARLEAEEAATTHRALTRTRPTRRRCFRSFAPCWKTSAAAKAWTA